MSKDREISKSPASLVDLVLNHILERLDDGSLSPGARLNAAEIASHLGVSRAPVREALAFLAGKGMVELPKDRGATLKQISRNDMIHIWEIAHAVGAIGIRRCAANISSATPEMIEKIRQHNQIIENTVKSGNKLLDIYDKLQEFHKTVNTIGGNDLVSELLNLSTIGYGHRMMIKYLRSREEISQYSDTYRRLIEAILAGDQEGAVGIWHFHVGWSIAQIAEANP